MIDPIINWSKLFSKASNQVSDVSASKSVVSSAKRIDSSADRNIGKSFMKILNKRGPKIDP